MSANTRRNAQTFEGFGDLEAVRILWLLGLVPLVLLVGILAGELGGETVLLGLSESAEVNVLGISVSSDIGGLGLLLVVG